MKLKQIVLSSLLLTEALLSQVISKDEKGLYDVSFGSFETDSLAQERMNYVKLDYVKRDENLELLKYFTVVNHNSEYNVIMDINALYPTAYRVSKTWGGRGDSFPINDVILRGRNQNNYADVLFKLDDGMTSPNQIIKDFCEYSSPSEFNQIKDKIKNDNGKLYPGSYFTIPKEHINKYYLIKDEVKKDSLNTEEVSEEDSAKYKSRANSETENIRRGRK
jgi:hypothetical protein